MKAVLDHIGIAVKDLSAALQFYRDGLGLEVEAPEEVPSQRVRAHFIPVGESSLGLEGSGVFGGAPLEAMPPSRRLGQRLDLTPDLIDRWKLLCPRGIPDSHQRIVPADHPWV